MTVMATLERANQIAKEAHAGQTRLDDRPYIVHPEWVRDALKTVGGSEAEQIVGVMHDVPEDNPEEWPLSRIRDEGYGDDVIVPLGLMIRDKQMPYDTYVHRPKSHPTSRRVKIYDNVHNLIDWPAGLEPNAWRERKVGQYACSLSCLMSPADIPCGSDAAIENEVKEIVAMALDLHTPAEEKRLILRVARAAEMAGALNVG